MIKYAVRARLSDLSGIPWDERSWAYYSGDGMWCERLGRAYLWENRVDAELFVIRRKENTASWDNKTVEVFECTDQEKFKARLQDE